MAETDSAISKSYSKLSELEYEFDDAEVELLKHQRTLFTPLYEKRAEIIKDVPRFWVMVFENFGTELDENISPEDWKLIGDHLLKLDVTRPDADQPRNFEVVLEFSENDWFEGTVLKKRFNHVSYRKQGFSALVSEPVSIKWKSPEKDLTGGTNETIQKVWELKKSALEAELSGKSEEKKTITYEIERLEGKLEEKLNSIQSFFIWFSWMGPYFDMMEREAKKGENEEKDSEDEDVAWGDIEVFPNGERLAYIMSDDLFPNAMKTFAEGMEEENLEEDGSDEDDEDDDASIELDSELEEQLMKGGMKFRSKNTKKKRKSDDEDDEMEGVSKKPKRT